MRAIKQWPWRRIVSMGSVVAISASLVVIAYASPGLPIAEVDLNDSGIWVTKQSSRALGRFNHQAGRLDGVVYPSFESFDVLQNDANVLLRDLTAGSFIMVDAANLRESGSTVGLPPNAQVVLGGGAVGVLDTNRGNFWAMPVGSAGSFVNDANIYEPTLGDLPEGARIAAGVDGTVYVLNPTDGTVTGFPLGEGAKPVVYRMAEMDGKAKFALTVVGATPVAFDRTNARLYVGTRAPVELGLSEVLSSGLALQQPSGPSGSVVYETGSSLVAQPLNGGAGGRGVGGAGRGAVGAGAAGWLRVWGVVGVDGVRAGLPGGGRRSEHEGAGGGSERRVAVADESGVRGDQSGEQRRGVADQRQAGAGG